MTGLSVAHSFDVWLPLTMTWAATQVRADGVDEAIVLAEAVDNLDQFAFSPLYAATAREAKLLRMAKRARLRVYPRSYARAIKRHEPQILHSHFGYRGWADVPLVRRHRLAHVVTFYGHDVTMYPRTWPVWRSRYTELFASADLVLCEGPFMAATVAGLGCPESKLQVQRLGVDLDRIPCRPRTATPGTPAKVLVAGAFRVKKGIPSALEAVAAARDRGADLLVTVVGGSNGSVGEEAERRRIEDVVRRRGLQEIVSFTGMIPYERLLGELSRHDIFLSPSRTAPDGDSEGGAPVTIIEAAASGMPVVSTTHCDIPQTVEDGRTGLLAPEGDQEALDECLRTLLEEPGRWPEMGAAAGRLARERFDMRRCAAQLAGRYRALAQRRAPTGA